MSGDKGLLKDYASYDASVKGTAIRFGIYTIVLAGTLASLPRMVKSFGTEIFRESALIENFQFSMLLIIALAFTVGAIVVKERSVIFGILAHVSGLAAIRELDSFFDRMISFQGWKLPAFIVLVSLIIFMVRRRSKVSDQVRWLINKRSFAILWAGFIITS